MPIGSIHSILSQDKDQYRLRPLTALYEGDSNYEDSEEASAAMVQMSEIHTLDAEEVEADITAGIDKMNLRTSYRRDIEEDEDDEEYYDEDYFEEDYDDYTGGATAIEEMEEVQMPQSMRRNWKEEQEWSSARY
ncbi:hypothetical protein BGX26_011758 [Mortierella sp. AD094]|nr:hypothetical protein BGX26_011758 [Mortierella sp. AD094]